MANPLSVAVAFPGQGSQKPGMGRDFYYEFAEARHTFEEASTALDLDVRALCFGDDPRIELTEYTQPALVTVEIAMFRVLAQNFGFEPAWFVGHSLGEYTALCASGAMALSDCVRIVRTRGRFMQEAVPPGRGAMLAVVGPKIAEHMTQALAEAWNVDVANYNSCDQVVLSGLASYIERVPSLLSEAFPNCRFETVPLNVSAPFHSRLMRPTEERSRPLLSALCRSIAPARVARVASNYTGDFHVADRAELVEALVRQASHPVRWIEVMRAVRGRTQHVVELGPGRPLSRLFRSAGLKTTSITTLKTAVAARATTPELFAGSNTDVYLPVS